MTFEEYIEEHTLRLDCSRRGGGIEIDASGLLGIKGAKMSAYQNYLGGGLLGRVMSDRNFTVSGIEAERAAELEEALKRYFFAITNEEAADYDSWAEQSYEGNQQMPESGY